MPHMTHTSHAYTVHTVPRTITFTQVIPSPTRACIHNSRIITEVKSSSIKPEHLTTPQTAANDPYMVSSHTHSTRGTPSLSHMHTNRYSQAPMRAQIHSSSINTEPQTSPSPCGDSLAPSYATYDPYLSCIHCTYSTTYHHIYTGYIKPNKNMHT